jgi:signal transduction histidine kinase
MPELQVYVGVPMRTGGRILGVLSVFGQAEQQFNVEEVALLASIGDQVGVVIENARLRQRAERAAVMEERGRLARELHDSVTQSLYSLTLLAGGGQRLARAGKLENVEKYLADLGEIAQQALKEMRLLVYQLRPTVLEQEGLVGALQQRLEAVEGRSSISTRLLIDEPLDLPAPVEEGLYRIAQEALNNTLKHSLANLVSIRIEVTKGWVILEVNDDGKGFDDQTIGNNGGLGLVSMKERAEALGGSLTVLSKPGQGVTVKARVRVQESV